MNRSGRLILPFLLASCSSGSVSMGPPPTPESVVTGFSEELLDRPGYRIFLRNDLASPVTITRLEFYECENVRVPCQPRDLAMVLEPGEVRQVEVVEPADLGERWRYRWRWDHQRGVPPGARDSFGAEAPEPLVLEESDEGMLLLDPRGRFVNLVLPDLKPLMLREWDREAAREAVRFLYRSFEDDFDFLLLAFPDDEAAEDWGGGRAARLRLAAGGLGLSTSDQTAAWGSDGRLLGVARIWRHSGLDGYLALHEIAHLWAAYLLEGTGEEGHWGFSGVGGLLGGWEPGSLEEVADGVWWARGPGGRNGFGLTNPAGAIQPYRPLELYAMGLLPADSVPPVRVAEEAAWLQEDQGLFEASGIRTVTIDELVQKHGPREPAYPDAPREFRGLYVVLSTRPLDGPSRNAIDEDVRDFGSDAPRQYRGYLNFWEATGGRGRVIMDGLEESLVR